MFGNVLSWVVGYSFFDYLAYGSVQDEKNEAPLEYRVLQALILLWIWFVQLSPTEAIAHFCIWITFGCDWIYYGFTLLPFKKILPKLDGIQETKDDFSNGITHAYWTPLGIWYKKNPIPIKALIIQSLSGFIVAYLFCI
jgi:hypothetical protein